MGFSGLAPTLPLYILCREGELAEDERKGANAARKPMQPSGTSPKVREHLTGVVEYLRDNSPRTLEEFYSSQFWY